MPAISNPVIPQKQKIKNRNIVIPAQAGISSFPRRRESSALGDGNIQRLSELSVRKLIGKNGFFRFYVLDSRFRGNDAQLHSDNTAILITWE
ncbi:Uncharacterised protein [Neisseria meningitidis]|nr:Uncharacterised protein [Neisseria meningitidis]